MFLGWFDENGQKLTEQTLMNYTTDGDPITFTAHYEQTTVSFTLDTGFNLNGGKWITAPVEGQYFSPTDPLPGITRVESEGSYTFKIHDDNTTDTDYRKTLMRKGYTFTGWKDVDAAEDDNTRCFSGPLYKHLKVIAQWEPNTYTLKLYSMKDESLGKQKDWTYEWVDNSKKNGSLITIPNVTVGQSLNIDAWPKREDWQIKYDAGGNNADGIRLLLGMTFDAMNPNVTQNGAYASNIVDLTNHGAVFNYGSNFFLPDDLTTVPDYPDGSIIDLYALYREISLVFVEYIELPTGTVHRVLAVCDWNTYSEPPKGYNSYEGYTMTGWLVNGTGGTGTALYQSEDYNQNRVSYKEQAETLGTYDIMVYTAYRPQKEYELRVEANAGTTTNESEKLSTTGALPSSFITSTFNYTVELSEGLNLVTSSELEKHLHDASWDTVYTPDNTFALTMTLKQGNTSQSIELSKTSNAIHYPMDIGAGAEISFTLKNANRLSGVTKPHTATVTMYWGNTDDGQKVTIPVTIEVKPATYDVVFNANLPADRGELIAKAEQTWYKDGTLQNVVKNQTYGSAYVFPDIAVDGMTFLGWSKAANDKENLLTDQSDMDLYTAGSNTAGTIYAQWTPNKHKLSADSDTLSRWSIAYSDVYTANGTSPDSGTQLTSTEAEVAWRGTVTAAFIGSDTRDHWPEFVTDSEDPTWSLLDATAPSGSDPYWFSMPDADRSLVFSRTKTLDLSKGDIVIAEDHYKIAGVSYPWHGDYVITQSTAETSNSLTITGIESNGEAADSTITLGKLNTTDVISIEASLPISMTDQVTAKKIAVADNCSVTLNGAHANAEVKLNLKHDSDIGIGGSNAGVIINSVKITADAEISALGTYSGSIIEGSTVSLNDVTIVSTGADSGAAKTVSGGNITITDSTLGSLLYGIKADQTLQTLTLANSTVSTSKQYTNFLKATTINVQQSNVTIASANYDGALKIHDAVSTVQTMYGRVIEVNNGNLTVNADGYTQGSSTKAYSGDIILLDEFGSEYAGHAAVTMNRDQKIIIGSDEVRVGGVTYGAATAPVHVTIDGTNNTLTSSANISGTGNLTLKDADISAAGHNVGSLNGDVSIVGNVTANVANFGALGVKDQSFTTVTIPADAALTVTGTLVRDWAHLQYHNLPSIYQHSNPQILRTQEALTAQTADMTYSFTVADAYLASDHSDIGFFKYWYLQDAAQTEILLDANPLNTEKNDQLTSALAQQSYNTVCTSETCTICAVSHPVIHLYAEAAFEITLDATLYAVDDPSRLSAGQQNALTIDLTAEDGANLDLEQLAGKVFKLNMKIDEPTTGFSIVDTATFDTSEDSLKKSAGSTYANTHFGIGLSINDGEESSLHWTGDNADKFTFPALEALGSKANLTLTIHNANALTITDTGEACAMKVAYTFVSEYGDKIMLNVTIKRVASQLSATVPLVLVMKTNIDGGTATVNDSSYHIDNNSSMDIALTHVKHETVTSTAEKQNPLTAESTIGDLEGKVDKYAIALDSAIGSVGTDGQLATAKVIPADTPEGNTDDTYNPIDAVGVSRLSFVTPEDEDQGVHFATLTYTVAIPETGSEQP